MAVTSGYTIKEVSSLGKPEYRVFFFKDNTPVSTFHDIPLWVDAEKGVANMVVEIPLNTRPKLEISKDIPFNPIKQDVKKGNLRYVHDPYPFNYGAFPQTWESPSFLDPRTQAKGDNDPIDVCEISGIPRKTGDVVPVKILGVWAMVDEGETDWKVLAIDAREEAAQKWNTGSDVPKEIVEKVFTFLRDYKIPDGNPPNKFAFDGELKDREFAIEITNETHKQWQQLIKGETENKIIQLLNVTGPNKVTPQEAEATVSKLLQ